MQKCLIVQDKRHWIQLRLFFKPKAFKGMKKEAIELNDAFTPCLQVDTSISLAARNLGNHSEFLMQHLNLEI